MLLIDFAHEYSKSILKQGQNYKIVFFYHDPSVIYVKMNSKNKMITANHVRGRSKMTSPGGGGRGVRQIGD